MYGIPILDPSNSPDPKSGCTGSVAPMKLIIAAEFGSTVAFAIFWFHALSAGKGRNPLRLPPCPRLIALQALAGGGGGGGGFPPDCEVTVTLMLAEVLLPGFGLLTLTPNIPALASEPVAVSFVDETKVVVTAAPPNNTCAPLTKLLPVTVSV